MALLVGFGALVSCGSSSDEGRPVATPSIRSGFASLPSGSPSSDYWIAGRLPDGYDIVQASVESGLHAYASNYSTDYTHERSNAPLQVVSSSRPISTLRGRVTTVRGHRAVVSTLTDDGRDYGVSLTWTNGRA